MHLYTAAQQLPQLLCPPVPAEQGKAAGTASRWAGSGQLACYSLSIWPKLTPSKKTSVGKQAPLNGPHNHMP